ncbi:aldehyde dehydrogenase [Salinibius halmophilus]|uniref:aldehyde dehydrogenase n=1 Tax=Salinibius halmophilus TaxID=1853216 RepID=UPI000E6671C7|nr:aldehyde dehydrogenase [Salinibius halmophilus]
MSVAELRQQQKSYFHQQSTKPYEFRIRMLDTLRAAIQAYEPRLMQALADDLDKSEFEAFSNEIGLLYSEISHSKKSLKKWMKAKRVTPDLALMPSKAWIQPEPYGSVLIIGPWNYPIQLLLMPLIGAVAAGNTAVIKPSELAPHCAEVVQAMIDEYFDQQYIAVVQGEADVTQALIRENFDHIFFTGSTPVGKKIMAAASEFLTPVTLELGGKSPAIVDETANLGVAARRIAFGKWNNAGQTCVAPDYVLVHESVAEPFVAALKEATQAFYGHANQSKEYGKIITERHHQRLQSLLPEPQRIVLGGDYDQESRYFAPTITYPAQWQDAAMEDEIFGPILPVLVYQDLQATINTLQKRDKPLALYCFSQSQSVQEQVTQELSFGGGMINGALLHVASHQLPFGGVGPSGMGSYHGKASFDCFSHHKSLVKQPSNFELSLMYPHKRIATKWLKKVMR